MLPAEAAGRWWVPSTELKTLRKRAGEPGPGARPGELTWLCSWRMPGKTMCEDSGIQSLLRPQLGALGVLAGSFLLPQCSGTPVLRQPPAPPHTQPLSPCPAHPPCGTGVGLEEGQTPQGMRQPLELSSCPQWKTNSMVGGKQPPKEDQSWVHWKD